MSKINELIQTLCPDGVEYKTLKDVLTIKNGRDYKSFNQGNVPVYGSGGIMAYVDTYAYDGPSVLIPRKGSLSNIFYVEGQFWTVDTIFYTIIDESQVLPKYVFYYLQNAHLEKLNQAGGVPSLSQGVLNPYPIPVPPLPVQEEIVRILDEYTDLEAELEAKLSEEIELKQKQYEFYRDELLTFGDDVERKKLGDVCSICTDYTAAGSFAAIAKNVQYMSEENYALLVRTMDIKSKFSKGNPIYVDKHAFEYLWRVQLSVDSIILPNIGNCGEVYYLKPQDIPYKNAVLAPNAILLRSENCNMQFFYYILQSSAFQWALHRITTPGGQTKFNKTDLKKLEIPVPSPTEQERIVKILDKYDTYTRDMISALNTELESRKKQYAYYRDQLLTFKRKD